MFFISLKFFDHGSRKYVGHVGRIVLGVFPWRVDVRVSLLNVYTWGKKPTARDRHGLDVENM